MKKQFKGYIWENVEYKPPSNDSEIIIKAWLKLKLQRKPLTQMLNGGLDENNNDYTSFEKERITKLFTVGQIQNLCFKKSLNKNIERFIPLILTVVIVGFLLKGCFSLFNYSDTEEKCLELSDLSGVYEVDGVINNEFAMSTGTSGVGDVTLKLSKLGTYDITIWNYNSEKIKKKISGSWRVKCDVENQYSKGEVSSQIFRNTIFLTGFPESEGGLHIISSSKVKGYLEGGYMTLKRD